MIRRRAPNVHAPASRFAETVRIETPSTSNSVGITSEMHRFNSRTMARRDFLKNNFQPMSSAQY
ncbi:hypothetical protein Y026_3406 [Burkholderia pseudomallei TSV28]|nr:hypothetical protein DO73_5349 [Burkholderia pseudomallei]KGX70640.1 hypothetical protein Y026_3406 [Burkholderia pseudomallei TSV28]